MKRLLLTLLLGTILQCGGDNIKRDSNDISDISYIITEIESYVYLTKEEEIEKSIQYTADSPVSSVYHVERVRFLGYSGEFDIGDTITISINKNNLGH